MGWTAGADVSTGDLITAAQWNNYLGASGSIEYLKDRLASGSYSGNNTANRAIAHGLSVTPKVVIIQDYTWGVHFLIFGDKISCHSNIHAVTTSSSTNFYVGNATSYPESANNTGRDYKWIAIG